MEATNEEFRAPLRRSQFSQADAARAMRLSTATISRYVTGEVDVPLSSLDHLSRIVRIPVSLPGEPTLGITKGPRWLEEWQDEILELMSKIPPKARRHFILALGAMINPSANEPGIPSTEELVRQVAGDLIEKAEAKPRAEDASQSGEASLATPSGPRPTAKGRIRKRHTSEESD